MSHKTSHKAELNVQQDNAIDLLVDGSTDKDVADHIGVARETVTRWRNDNPYFAAELNRHRNALWQSAHERLRSLVGEAADTLEAAVDAGDVKAAVEILKAVRLYGEVGAPTGEEDPELLLFRRAEAWAAGEVVKATPKGDLAAMLTRDEREAELTLRRFRELGAGLGG